MSKTTSVIGGIIIILLALIVFMLASRNPNIVTSIPNGTTTSAENTAVADQVSVPDSEDVVGTAPVATTNETVAPTDTTAVVTGTVNPNGAITAYWYEYGLGTSLGKQSEKQSVGSGRVATLAPGYITELTKNTTYYYRLVAENQYGRSNGILKTVRTSGASSPASGTVPTSKTFPADAITNSGATLRGEVNPNKGMTQYWFEYGRSANLGHTTAFVSIGNGDASIVATASPKLNANTTYYFRINAQNEYGTVNGTILSFKTGK